MTPPTAKKVKDLHLAKSLDELNKQVAISAIKGPSILPTLKMVDQVKKLFDRATLGYNSGDEELAYVLYMRMHELIKSAKNKAEVQKGVKKELMLAIERTEELFGSLDRRYKINEEIREQDKRVVEQLRNGTHTATENGDSNAVDKLADRLDKMPAKVEDEPPPRPPTAMTCNDLYQLLRDRASSLILIDIRSAEDFDASQVKSSRVFNVPESVIKPGLIATHIADSLMQSSDTHGYQLFSKRGSVRDVILMDWQSKADDQRPKMKQVFRALAEYDVPPIQPRVLEGGYDAFHARFPTFTTNPHATKHAAAQQIIQEPMRQIRYPLQDVLPKQTEKAREKPRVQPTVVSNGSVNYPSITDDTALRKIEAAQPCPVPQPTSLDHHRPSVPDRSTKRQLIDEHRRNVQSTKEASNRMDDGLAIARRSLEESDRNSEGTSPPPPQSQARAARTQSKKADEMLLSPARLIDPKTQHKTAEASEESKELDSSTTTTSNSTVSSSVSSFASATQSTPKSTSATSTSTARAKPDPSMPSRSSKPATSSTTPNNSLLSSRNRFPSSPNLANLATKLPPASTSRGEPRPQIDRSTKPAVNAARTQYVSDIQTEYSASARVVHRPQRQINGVYGSKQRPGLTGLRNIGNTCFMNSIIQCLSNTVPLRDYFIKNRFQNDINDSNPMGFKGEIAVEFAAVINYLWRNQYKYITPSDFKAVVSRHRPMFAGTAQQDAQEFLVFLLDGLHEDLNQVRQRRIIPEQNNDDLSDHDAARKAWVAHRSQNLSQIADLFQGQYKSTVRCLVCNRQSTTFDTFMYLSLPVPANTRCNIKTCLDLYLKAETMTNSCRWRCPACKELRDAEKRITLWKLPAVLLIHLKRFRWHGVWRDKISSVVEFPVVDFDLSGVVPGETPRDPYQLFGVVQHSGTLDGGHYIAYCDNHGEDESRSWFRYDDTDVTEVSESSVRRSEAYVLFYTNLRW